MSQINFFDLPRSPSPVDEEMVNDEPVRNNISESLQSAHRRALGLWDFFCARYPEPPKSVDNAKDLKLFMYRFLQGKRELLPKGKTLVYGDIKQRWDSFTGAYRRLRGPIDPLYVRNVHELIKPKGGYGKLFEIAPDSGPRRHVTKGHLIWDGEFRWLHDYKIYSQPRRRIIIHSVTSSAGFTGARSSCYLHSKARGKKKEIGLLYEDLTFLITKNEVGEPEFALQLTKKLKGRDERSSKLPQPGLHENLFPEEETSLYLNPILFMLVIFFREDAFMNYKGPEGLKELLDKKPIDDQDMKISFDPKVLNTPVFRGPNGTDLLNGDSFQKDFREGQIRSGNPEPYGLHALRSEFLTQVDTNKKYSGTQRRQTAGHVGDQTHQLHYAARNPGIDGQAAYLGKEARKLNLAEKFRQFEVDWRPDLAQELPSAEFRELCQDKRYNALKASILDLKFTDSRKVKRDLKKLEENGLGLKTKLSKTESLDKRQPKAQLEKLEQSRLRDYWKKQGAPETQDRKAYRTVGVDLPFERLRPVLPIRSQLADILDKPIKMRDKEGRKAIELLIELYEAKTEVYRSGLDADLCTCPGRKTKNNLHVYECFKQRNKFAEFCFSPCNQWFFSQEDWDQHCEKHLNDGSLHKEVAWGKVEHAFVPGYCPFCRWDENLNPGTRLRAFPTEEGWREHISNHDFTTHCHDPECNKSFKSEIDFQDHMKDVHRVPTELLVRNNADGGCRPTEGGQKRKFETAFEYCQAPEAKRKVKLSTPPLKTAQPKP